METIKLSATPVDDTPLKTLSIKVAAFKQTATGFELEVHGVNVASSIVALELDALELILTVNQKNSVDEKTTIRKFQLPVAFPASHISAKHSATTGILLVTLKTPTEGSTGEIEIATFVCAAATTSAERVSFSATQGEGAFSFACVPSKFETTVKVVLEGN